MRKLIVLFAVLSSIVLVTQAQDAESGRLSSEAVIYEYAYLSISPVIFGKYVIRADFGEGFFDVLNAEGKTGHKSYIAYLTSLSMEGWEVLEFEFAGEDPFASVSYSLEFLLRRPLPSAPDQ